MNDAQLDFLRESIRTIPDYPKPGIQFRDITTLLRDDLPPWLGALALAALFSAEVSTADAVLFMLSTSLARDLYAGHLRRDASQGDQLRVVRIAAVLSGALGIAIAIWAGSIVRTMSLFYSVLSGSLFVPVVAGVFLPRADRRHALAAMVVGVGTTAGVHIASGGLGLAGMAPVLWGLSASALALLVSLAIVGGSRNRA